MSVTEPSETGISDSGRLIHRPAGGAEVRWWGGDVYRILASRKESAKIGLIDGIIPVGGGPSAHVHERSDHTFYVISGKIAFLHGEKTLTVVSGTSVHVPRRTPHRFMNVGEEEARLLIVVNPAGPEMFLLDAGDKPHPGSAPAQWPPARVAEAITATAHLDVDIVLHPEFDYLFQPEGGRPVRRPDRH